MIDPKEAAKQVQRLSGLDFFPKEAAAQKEMRLALECAASDAIAASVVTDWLATASDAPKPAELRRMAYDLNEKFQTQARRCQECVGSGFVTIWRLVTYVGKSYAIKRSERVDGGYEEAMRLARVLAEPLPGADRQQETPMLPGLQCALFPPHACS